jgi:hypothetical protein
LRDQHGHTGSVSQVRRYIQRRRGELGLLPRGAVTLDRIQEPNGMGEADWKQIQIYPAGATSCPAARTE